MINADTTKPEKVIEGSKVMVFDLFHWKLLSRVLPQAIHNNLNADDHNWEQRKGAFDSSCLTLMKHTSLCGLDSSENSVCLNAGMLTHGDGDELLPAVFKMGFSPAAAAPSLLTRHSRGHPLPYCTSAVCPKGQQLYSA